MPQEQRNYIELSVQGVTIRVPLGYEAVHDGKAITNVIVKALLMYDASVCNYQKVLPELKKRMADYDTGVPSS